MRRIAFDELERFMRDVLWRPGCLQKMRQCVPMC